MVRSDFTSTSIGDVGKEEVSYLSLSRGGTTYDVRFSLSRDPGRRFAISHSTWEVKNVTVPQNQQHDDAHLLPRPSGGGDGRGSNTFDYSIGPSFQHSNYSDYLRDNILTAAVIVVIVIQCSLQSIGATRDRKEEEATITGFYHRR